MGFWLYNALILALSPVWSAALVWRLVWRRKDRRAFWQRWRGLGADALPADAGSRSPRVWIHAVSVGETMAVVPLVKALRREHPGALLVGSTVTDLGQEMMRAKLPELDAVCYLPYDLGWSVRRTVETIRPSLFLFAETELWPNLLLTLRRRGVPTAMVNGRVSERSVRRYRWIAPFIRRVVRSVTALTVQREADRERFIRLGAVPARVMVCGNLKADGAAASPGGSAALLTALGTTSEKLIIAGSTHHSEERDLATVFLDLLTADPSLRLCVAPRHLDRCVAIEAELRAMGLSPVRRSRLPAAGRRWDNAREIVLLDTMGELTAAYTLAAVVVMGGTFAPIGGHNLLEPAAAGRPVLFGPHIGQWKSLGDELAAAGGALALDSVTALAVALRRVLADNGTRRRMGESALAYVRSQQGATARTMAVIDHILRGEGTSVVPSLKGEDRERCVERRAAMSAWLWNGGAWGVLLKRLLAPAAWGYGTVMAARRRWYHRGWLAVTRLPAHVISVGNLTVGGSGKTPIVMSIARMIASTGRPVGVISRGYLGSRPNDPWLVSDGRAVLATVEEAGDEALLLARRLEGIPVAVGRDRVDAGRLLLTRTPPGRHMPEVLIMDDGFQHLKLHRDVNLLVIDGGRSGLNQRLLPCGPLREAWSAARDASAVIVVERPGAEGNGVNGDALLRERLNRVGFDGPVFVARLQPSGLVSLPSGEALPLTALSGVDAAICSGIGHPDSFRDVVVMTGARIVKEWVFQDHHRYTSHEIESIMLEARRLGATMLVTTEKDAVKLAVQPSLASGGGPPLTALRMELAIEPELDWRRWLGQQGALSAAVPPAGAVDRPSNPVHSAALVRGALAGGII